MVRTHQSAWTPADIAERDSTEEFITAEQEKLIDARVAATIELKLQQEPGIVDDLLSDLLIGTHLCRIFRNLDRAAKGEQIAHDAVFTALNCLHRDVTAKANSWWGDAAREEAETAILN